MSAEPPRPPVPPEETRPMHAPLAPRAPVGPPVVERYVEAPPPPYPPAGRWGDNPWPAIGLALVALVLGGIVGYAIGHKSEPSNTEPGASARTVTNTVTNTRTVVRPKVVEHSQTVTAASPENKANEERRTEAEARVKKLERENEELKRAEAG